MSLRTERVSVCLEAEKHLPLKLIKLQLQVPSLGPALSKALEGT